MRKLIVGCGYLGRRVAHQWLAAGDMVYALTRSPQHAEEFRQLGLHPVIGDVMQASSLNDLPSVDTVLYAVGLDRTSGFSQRDVYVDGLRNVLTVLRDKVHRFLYISSTSVYGQNSGEWVDENSECHPTRPNGQVCLDAEQLVREFFPQDPAGSSASATIFRLAGIYGPDRLLSKIQTLRQGSVLRGNPLGWLNLIHVDDAVRVLQACETAAKTSPCYLVADDQPMPRLEYYSLLASLVDAPPPQFEPVTPAADSTGKGLNKRCSNARLHADLGVRLAYPSYREGLPHALNASTNQ